MFNWQQYGLKRSWPTLSYYRGVISEMCAASQQGQSILWPAHNTTSPQDGSRAVC